MTKLSDVPFFDGRSFLRVNEGLFGEAVRMVVAEAGPMDDDKAMRIVEAVFGPLKLLSPVDDLCEEGFRSVCGHLYFRYEGGWRYCTRLHNGPDDGDPEFHRSDDGTEWESDAPYEGRSFTSEEKR